MVSTAFSTISGLRIGYEASTARTNEVESMETDSHYWAALSQGTQVFLVGEVAQKALRLSFDPISNFVLFTVVPMIGALACVLFAAVKKGHYPTLASLWNKIPILFKLPQQLSEEIELIVTFLSDHSGEIMKGLIVIGAIASIAMGNVFFGLAVLAFFLYDELDQRNMVPAFIKNFKAFLDEYMPLVVVISLFVEGSIMGGIFALPMLITYAPKIADTCQRLFCRAVANQAVVA